MPCGSSNVAKPPRGVQVNPCMTALLPLPTVYVPTTSSWSFTPSAVVADAPGTARSVNLPPTLRNPSVFPVAWVGVEARDVAVVC